MNSKLSLESLEVLDAIARKGSFAAAADSLFRVPSAITYAVRKLESDLGIKIFDRKGHRAELTEAGAELLREGRQLLRAAQELENRVKRVATGIETELSIAFSDLFSIEPIYRVLDQFYQQGFGTRIRILREVYGGSWDALTTGRADISVGAPGDPPPGSGFITRPLGRLEFLYAVAPHHPLASLPEPLQNQDIMQYRAVSAADTSRDLPPRTSGILGGQEVLSVPDMQSKLLAHIHGLGVGYLPRRMAEQYAERGLLVIKQVVEPKPEGTTYLAWSSCSGKAKDWLIKAFSQLQLEELLM